MTKKDKKFLMFLAFAQTGVLFSLISVSGWFWSQHTLSVMHLNTLKNLSEQYTHSLENRKFLQRVNKQKRSFEGHGVGVKISK